MYAHVCGSYISYHTVSNQILFLSAKQFRNYGLQKEERYPCHPRLKIQKFVREVWYVCMLLITSLAYRVQLWEVLLEGVAEHHFLVPLAEEVQAELRAIVKQTPFKMALESWPGALVSSWELNPQDASTCLQARLFPEEWHETTDLDERCDAVVNIDGLLCLSKVGYVTFIIHTPHIESATHNKEHRKDVSGIILECTQLWTSSWESLSTNKKGIWEIHHRLSRDSHTIRPSTNMRIAVCSINISSYLQLFIQLIPKSWQHL